MKIAVDDEKFANLLCEAGYCVMEDNFVNPHDAQMSASCVTVSDFCSYLQPRDPDSRPPGACGEIAEQINKQVPDSILWANRPMDVKAKAAVKPVIAPCTFGRCVARPLGPAACDQCDAPGCPPRLHVGNHNAQSNFQANPSHGAKAAKLTSCSDYRHSGSVFL